MVNNPQFPHRCIVTRLEDNSSDPLSGSAGEEMTIIYDTICQNQINEVGDVVYREGVLFSDYTTYLPLDIPIQGGQVKKGDIIVVNDGSRVIKAEVSQFERGNIGIRIWSNGIKGE